MPWNGGHWRSDSSQINGEMSIPRRAVALKYANAGPIRLGQQRVMARMASRPRKTAIAMKWIEPRVGVGSAGPSELGRRGRRFR